MRCAWTACRTFYLIGLGKEAHNQDHYKSLKMTKRMHLWMETSNLRKKTVRKILIDFFLAALE